MTKTNRQRGTLLVEILVASMVLGTILLTAATTLGIALDGITSARLANRASLLLQEELEPLLTIRDSGWANISTNGMFYVAPTGSSWTLTSTTTGETVDQFTRNVVISNVSRDSSGQIVDTGGTIDLSTKKAVATVSWQGFLPHTLSATVYITRYKDNLQEIWTTKEKFDLGTHSGTISQLTGSSSTDGEVILGAGGSASWCAPSLTLEQENLPKSGVANAVTAIEGRAFAGTGENSSGEAFVNVGITNANPPDASILGAMNGYKTNDVFGEANYGYIATDTNSKEFVIISIANTPYSESGYFNAPGNTDANSVFVSGNIAYVTTADNKLYNVDLANCSTGNRSGSCSAFDSDGVSLAGTGNSVYVVGNYAYVATSNTDSQLQIIDVSNTANLTVVGSVDLDAAGAADLFVNGSATRAYVVTSESSSQREFFIINIETKSSPVLVSGGTYDTNGMSPRGVEIVPGGRAIVVGTGGEEYQAINVSNEASLSRCGGIEVSSGVFDSASVLESDNDAYSYIVTGDASSEFKIIEGGPGGSFATSGVYESETFDPGYQTAFNRFTASFNKPAQTDIQFQVSGADVGGDGTCNTASFTFVGPDGTTGTYFTTTTSPITEAIPLSPGPGFQNSAKCFRFRAYLTTSDAGQSPALYDFTVNYSP